MTALILRRMSDDSDFIYLSEAFNIGIHSQNPDKNELICYCDSIETANKFCSAIEQSLKIDTQIEQKENECLITLPSFKFNS